MGDLVPHIGDDVGLGLLHGEAGDLFQHLQLAFLDKSHFLLLRFHSGDLVAQRLALLLDRVGLAVEGFFLLLQAAFLLLDLGAARLFLPLIFGAGFVYFFLCLDESFTLFALGRFNRFVYDPRGRHLFPVGIADQNAQGRKDDDKNNR